eukprot:scaffold15662_cov62-Phaeocystis_antarctica.AAC.3
MQKKEGHPTPPVAIDMANYSHVYNPNPVKFLKGYHSSYKFINVHVCMGEEAPRAGGGGSSLERSKRRCRVCAAAVTATGTAGRTAGPRCSPALVAPPALAYTKQALGDASSRRVVVDVLLEKPGKRRRQQRLWGKVLEAYLRTPCACIKALVSGDCNDGQLDAHLPDGAGRVEAVHHWHS